MTIEEKMRKTLFDYGIFDDVIDAIMVSAKATIGPKVIDASRWADNVESYPRELFAVLWMSVKDAAIDWGKANKPQAFWIMALSAK